MPSNNDKLRAAIAELQPLGAEEGDIKVSPSVTIFENAESWRSGPKRGERRMVERVMVSAEDGSYFADYYGEYRGGCPWIDPRIEAAAKELGMFWEWRDPGSIVAYEL